MYYNSVNYMHKQTQEIGYYTATVTNDELKNVSLMYRINICIYDKFKWRLIMIYRKSLNIKKSYFFTIKRFSKRKTKVILDLKRKMILPKPLV